MKRWCYNKFMAVFKVNIYPLIYWGLAYGLIAGFVLFVLFLLSKYITVIWFPVFLGGLLWGGYRNYRKQKDAWGKESNTPSAPQSAVDEVKEAASDIFSAAKEMVAEQLEPVEGVKAEETGKEQGVGSEAIEIPRVEKPTPPSAPIEQDETAEPESPEIPKPPV